MPIEDLFLKYSRSPTQNYLVRIFGMKFYTQLALSIAAIAAAFFSFVSAECPNACRFSSILCSSFSDLGKSIFF